MVTLSIHHIDDIDLQFMPTLITLGHKPISCGNNYGVDVIDFDEFDNGDESDDEKQLTNINIRLKKIRRAYKENVEARRDLKVLRCDKHMVREKCFGIVVGYVKGKDGPKKVIASPTKDIDIPSTSNNKGKVEKGKNNKGKKGKGVKVKGFKVKHDKPICPWTLHVSNWGGLGVLDKDYSLRFEGVTAFIKGPFIVQILTTFGIDSNNGVYVIAYAIVEAKLAHFDQGMEKLKALNPKAHEWLQKIPASSWSMSHFSDRHASGKGNKEAKEGVADVEPSEVANGPSQPVQSQPTHKGASQQRKSARRAEK
ncbi:hypothetical protein Tco_0520873 [Tanacetum coccineum]